MAVARPVDERLQPGFPIRAETLLLFASGLALYLLAGLSPAHAQTADPRMWSVGGGDVRCTARAGNTIYIGGKFGSVGPAYGSGVEVDGLTGEPRPRPPRVLGEVRTVLPDGQGGWFIGGQFTAVGGRPHRNLAHVLSSGAVSDWRPEPDGPVDALALSNGTLYVGGEFRSIGGQERNLAAGFDARSGALRPWNPDLRSDVPYFLPSVRTILANGSTLFLGGGFTTVGGKRRGCIAAIDAVSGSPTPWDPSADSYVLALAIRDSTLYVGGYFYNIAGMARRYLAALSTTTGATRAWDARVDRVPEFVYDGGPCVRALLIEGDRLFVGGRFNQIGGGERQGLAAIDLTAGDTTAWNPHAETDYFPPASFHALALNERTLYVAGSFARLGGAGIDPNLGSLGQVAALDTETGLATTWNPRIESRGSVGALATSGNSVFVGGYFSSLWNRYPRAGLAAFDATTGEVTPWNPWADNVVTSMIVRGGKVYVSGYFSSVGSRPRHGVAQIDAATGAVTDWDAGCDGFVKVIAAGESTLYIGGWFANAGGQARTNLAEVDTLTGSATNWDPHPNDLVWAIVRRGRDVYAGGDFSVIGDSTRHYLAAINAETGAVMPWNPSPDSYVTCLALTDTTTYAGGYFSNIGGEPRLRLAAVSTITGLATDWRADADDDVETIAIGDGALYVGGSFTRINGVPHRAIAALEPLTGKLLDWDPHIPDASEFPPYGGYVWSLTPFENTVYVGGWFPGVGTHPCGSFAAVSGVPRLLPPGWSESSTIALAQSAPNPARGGTTIRFRLRQTERVDLEVFDLQGRLSATLLRNEPLAPGEHAVTFNTSSLRPGCYFYRLSTGRPAITRKLVVAG